MEGRYRAGDSSPSSWYSPLSYLAFLFSPFLPDAPEAVYGLKGAFDVYGSMHNVLFGLCAAGVISCIVRKYFG